MQQALRAGATVEQVHEATGIDPWFLDQLQELVEFEEQLRAVRRLTDSDATLIRKAKRHGYSDRQLATLWAACLPDEEMFSSTARVVAACWRLSI